MTNVIMYSIYFFLKYSIYFKNKKQTKKTFYLTILSFFLQFRERKSLNYNFLIYFFPYILFEVCLNSHKSGFFL